MCVLNKRENHFRLFMRVLNVNMFATMGSGLQSGIPFSLLTHPRTLSKHEDHPEWATPSPNTKQNTVSSVRSASPCPSASPALIQPSSKSAHRHELASRNHATLVQKTYDRSVVVHGVAVRPRPVPRVSIPRVNISATPHALLAQ